MSNSTEHKLHPELRHLIRSMMIAEGRDLTTCENCDSTIRYFDHLDIHHDKYEKATYYDLRILCRKCNNQPELVGLA